MLHTSPAGESRSLDGPVVLATGGYAADFSDTSLLKKHRPDTFGLATTNGTHATGDGQKMGPGHRRETASTWTRCKVHPTGLVDPRDPGSKWKFLAAEALRGEGGLLLNAEGDRFCDELGHRDYVSGMMWKEKDQGRFPIRLVLNSKASNTLDFHTRHYSGRGAHEENERPRASAGDRLLSRAPAADVPDVQCHRRRQPEDPWGKKFFPSVPLDISDTFHVSVMEPVLHFTMGGVEINDQAQVLNGEKKPFEGLYACGELAGGVHGANRLGGSSLLGCVVYGRVAGDSASNYLFQQALKGATGAAQRLGQISLHIDPSQQRGGWPWNGEAAAAAARRQHPQRPSRARRLPPVPVPPRPGQRRRPTPSRSRSRRKSSRWRRWPSTTRRRILGRGQGGS